MTEVRIGKTSEQDEVEVGKRVGKMNNMCLGVGLPSSEKLVNP